MNEIKELLTKIVEDFEVNNIGDLLTFTKNVGILTKYREDIEHTETMLHKYEGHEAEEQSFRTQWLNQTNQFIKAFGTLNKLSDKYSTHKVVKGDEDDLAQLLVRLDELGI